MRGPRRCGGHTHGSRLSKLSGGMQSPSAGSADAMTPESWVVVQSMRTTAMEKARVRVKCMVSVMFQVLRTGRDSSEDIERAERTAVLEKRRSGSCQVQRQLKDKKGFLPFIPNLFLFRLCTLPCSECLLRDATCSKIKHAVMQRAFVRSSAEGFCFAEAFSSIYRTRYPPMSRK